MADTKDAIAGMDIAVDLEDAHAYELARMRHSCAHLMAEAVQELFPDAKFAIGPAIEHGFYYDMDLPRPLSRTIWPRSKNGCATHQTAAEPFVRKDVSRDRGARDLRRQPVQGRADRRVCRRARSITTYQQGRFPRSLPGTARRIDGRDRPLQAASVAGAYWRGDEKRPMLQRIYGTAWPTQEELDDYLHRLEEAQRRDHRRLGKELDLFSVNEEIGPGLILWHPEGRDGPLSDRAVRAAGAAGARLRPRLHAAYRVGEDLQDLGHLETYRENMYSPMSIEEVDYYLKPMNCPGHIMIYKSQLRSYRDLPVRYAELGTVYRYERSGTLHGMLRVRGFTQDDAHIFCTPEQVDRRSRAACIDFAMHMAERLRLRVQGVPGDAARRSRSATTRSGSAAIGALRRRMEQRGPELQARRGRRRVLRAEDRHQVGRRARSRVDGTDDPGRFQPARAVRCELHRRGRRAAPGGHDPPHAAWARWSASSAG